MVFNNKIEGLRIYSYRILYSVDKKNTFLNIVMREITNWVQTFYLVFSNAHSIQSHQIWIGYEKNNYLLELNIQWKSLVYENITFLSL